MRLIGETAIDGWGNKIQLYAEEGTKEASNNRSYVNTELKLHVVSGGHVTAGYADTYLWGTGKELGAVNYGAGDYSLQTKGQWVTHNTDGSKTETIGDTFLEGWFGDNGEWIRWNVSGYLILTKFDRRATINTFTGTDIKENFNATYTTNGSGLTYKLKIRIPNDATLQTYDNYTSGTNVKLSDNVITYIKNYTSAKTIQLGGIIETWSESTKIGDSSEIKITVNIKKPARIRVSGAWKEATPYVRVNGAWKEATTYMRVNGAWKEEN